MYWVNNTQLQFGDVGVQIVVGDWNLEAFGQIAVAGWLKFAQQFGDCNSYANTLFIINVLAWRAANIGAALLGLSSIFGHSQ